MIKKWLPGLIGLSAFALLGRLLGFTREILMATKFGATQITDAYLTTLLLYDIMIAANTSILSGTLSYSTQVKDPDNFSGSLFKLGIILFSVVFAVAIISYPLIGWLVPMIFTKSAAAAQIVIKTSRLLLFLGAFLTAGGVFSALLQLRGDITNPGKLVVFLNIASITFLIILSKYLGIISLPLGLLFGGFLFFIYQIYLIYKTDDKNSDKSENRFLSILGWGSVVLLIFGNSLLPSIYGLIERYFAYSFVVGTFSHYQYASKIISLPLTIVSFAISTSLLPIQAKSINAGDENEFMSATNKGILISVVTSSFFVLIFSVLPRPIIHLIYQHGLFTPHDSAETALALHIMSFGLIPFLLNPIIANVFYSLRSIKSLIGINVFFILVQTGILFLLSRTISGIETLTVTWAIVTWINAAVQIYYLVHLKNLRIDKVIVVKLVFVLLITVVLIIAGKNFAGLLFPNLGLLQNSWQILIRIIAAGIILLIAFLSAVYFVFRDMLKDLKLKKGYFYII